MTGKLDELFASCRTQRRAALIGYLPAGYPNVADAPTYLQAMIDGGCDVIEVGLPFSDPVMDGPVIAAAQRQALADGCRIADVLRAVESITSRGGRAVVMSYVNPLYSYGFARFARDLACAGGTGIVTPDLNVDEADEYLAGTAQAGVDPIFLVAPSSSAQRIAATAAVTGGFLYAAAVMGVTGRRVSIAPAALDLVRRCRASTDLPIGVGLGVSSGVQAAEIAQVADAVIVGSAFVSRVSDGPAALAALAGELAAGVRERSVG